jgi:hypothetical protein
LVLKFIKWEGKEGEKRIKVREEKESEGRIRGRECKKN